MDLPRSRCLRRHTSLLRRCHDGDRWLEERVDRGAEPVHAGRRLVLDQVPKDCIGCPGTAVDGLGDLLRLARDGVASNVDPDLPDAFPTLALRASHEHNPIQTFRVVGTEVGMAIRETGGPVLSDRP